MSSFYDPWRKHADVEPSPDVPRTLRTDADAEAVPTRTVVRGARYGIAACALEWPADPQARAMEVLRMVNAFITAHGGRAQDDPDGAGHTLRALQRRDPKIGEAMRHAGISAHLRAN